MGLKLTNFAYSVLTIGITASDTTLAVTGGTGARFPTLGVGDYFYLTLENSSAAREIVKVTARATDTFTIVRAQDGTTARAWNSGDSAALRLNAAAINETVLASVPSTGTTGSAVLPTGTTAQRDAAPAIGYTRMNTTTGQPEVYTATGWSAMGGAQSGAVYLNSQTLSSSLNIPTGFNGHTVGPLNIPTGMSITLATGSRLVVL